VDRSVRGRTRRRGARDSSIGRRQVLGLGVLALTLLPAYRLSLRSGDPDEPAPQSALDAASGPVPAAPPGAVSRRDIRAYVRTAALRHGVPPELVLAIVEAESDFNPQAVSRRGARGLMQLMPVTASSLDVDDSFDPYANIEAGVRHLRRLIDRFDGDLPLVLAAYNAGEGAVQFYGGVPPYRETRRYVARILRRLGRQVRFDGAREIPDARRTS
jgi:soluble lytic murein transglycosylase-like protein